MTDQAPARRDPEALLAAATRGDRVALARLLSLVERGGEPAHQLGRLTFPKSTGSYTIGVTGAPGSGKSTLTDRLIFTARDEGADQIGVLAVDPSSPLSGGAILGDRVRMQDHALDPGVFIRSMASRGHLGGLALAVPEAMRVLAAVGVGLVLVETVGVGQVEVEVAAATDTTVVVVNPGWGDAVQANKAGLLEVADLFVINKADRPGARETRRDLQMMLDMSHLSDWRPPIVETTARTGEGVDELWKEIVRHRSHLEADGRLEQVRLGRAEEELRQVLRRRLSDRVDELIESGEVDDVRAALRDRKLDPYDAAERMIAKLTG